MHLHDRHRFSGNLSAVNARTLVREAVMRTNALAVIALLALSSGLGAQGVRLPRIGGTMPQPTSLPPEAPGVTRALAYKRSRWSAEGYSLISAIQVPGGAGGMTSYTSFGAGTHADYRYTDRVSATADVTVSTLGGQATAETAEVGMRFRPMPFDEQLRPFFDVRAAYMHMYDTYAIPGGAGFTVGGPGQFIDEGRYSRGVGGIGGAGLEYSLTRTLSLTTELSALRNRMDTYRLTGAAGLPGNANYWMTSYRFTLGLKYNPVSALHMVQKTAP
jgi:hypothetical protein